MAGIWTNAGLNLLASAVQDGSITCNITNVAISAGCGTLSSAITTGVATTTLALDAGLPVGLSSGQSLTVTDGTNSETVTTNGAASASATSITINSWTPAHSYAAHTTGVAPTPLITDIALYNEAYRVTANVGTAGAAAGESLNTGYFDGTQATGIYLLVGYFGALGHSSVLMIEDVQYWNHTSETDSNMYQADSTV